MHNRSYTVEFGDAKREPHSRTAHEHEGGRYGHVVGEELDELRTEALVAVDEEEVYLHLRVDVVEDDHVVPQLLINGCGGR